MGCACGCVGCVVWLCWRGQVSRPLSPRPSSSSLSSPNGPGGAKEGQIQMDCEKKQIQKGLEKCPNANRAQKSAQDPVLGTFSASIGPFISICRPRLILAEEIGLFLTLPFKLSQYVHFQDQLIPALTYWPRKQVYIRQGGCCLT